MADRIVGGDALSGTETNLSVSLPAELLEGIFSLYVHTDDGPRSIKRARISALSFGHPNTPVVLGHVCSRWRNIAHSAPRLWSTIHVGKLTALDIAMFEMWLERSYPAPLFLTFNDAGSYSEFWRNILGAAISESHRWEYLDVTLHNPYIEEKWHTLHVPNLKAARIRLNWSSDSSKVLPRDLYQRMFTSPVLEELSCDGECYTPTWGPNFPWRNLKNVSIFGYPNADKVYELLKECASLEKCEAHVTPLNDSPNLSSRVTAPSSLRTLTLVYQGYGSCHVPLGIVTLPALTELSIRWSGGSSTDMWQILADLGARSNWPLKTLAFNGVKPFSQVEVADLSSALLVLSQLTRLQIVTEVGDAFLKAISFTEFSQPLPNLESLYLPMCRSTDGVLSDMLLSRTVANLRETPVALRHVNVGLWGSSKAAKFEKDLALRVPNVILEINVKGLW